MPAEVRARPLMELSKKYDGGGYQRRLKAASQPGACACACGRRVWVQGVRAFGSQSFPEKFEMMSRGGVTTRSLSCIALADTADDASTMVP